MSQCCGEQVGIITLGCARNEVDSEKILSDEKKKGANILSAEKASTVFVNTCGFAKDAKQESIGAITDLIALKKKGKIKKIVVCGCLVERYEKELRENFKEVDEFRGIADFKKDFDVRLASKHYAYLKISEGCANACSYCAIPIIKGPLRSRTEKSILKEAQYLSDNGVKELNIVGQDITLFGLNGVLKTPACLSGRQANLPLVNLLKKILKKTRIPWIRLLYLHPKRLSCDLMELIASEKRICSYVDLPLQHINDRILKLMNRGINKKAIVDLIEKLRSSVPDIALRTSMIVGFPSETKKEFQELLDFVKVVKFDRLGAFLYSREENTRAYNFKGQLNEKIKSQRYDALMSLQQDISESLRKRYIGRTIEVMVDEVEKSYKGSYVGRSYADAPEVDGVVFLKSKIKLIPGNIVKCRVTNAYEYDLAGEVEN